jgi:excisionase family DNA binding protein
MMTARQVAELLGVHENWVYEQAASGELPSYKIGGTRRFDRDELRGWIAEHRQVERRRQAQYREGTRAAQRSRNLRRETQTHAGQEPSRPTHRRGASSTEENDAGQSTLFET